jgi:hypothetical protein
MHGGIMAELKPCVAELWRNYGGIKALCGGIMAELWRNYGGIIIYNNAG